MWIEAAMNEEAFVFDVLIDCPFESFSKARCLRIAWRSGQLLKRFVIFCRGGCKINVRLTTVESRMWQTSQSRFNLRLNEKHLRTIHVRHSASSIIPERKEDSWFWFAVIGKAEFTKKRSLNLTRYALFDHKKLTRANFSTHSWNDLLFRTGIHLFVAKNENIILSSSVEARFNSEGKKMLRSSQEVK